MSGSVKPIPDGYHTVTPYLVVRGADEAMSFYKRAFGAETMERMTGPDGKTVIHAEIRIGSSILMVGDENPQWQSKAPKSLGGSPVSFYVYVEDVDAFFKKAVAAGATEKMPVSEMFWGDRTGQVEDPFGYKWSFATHTRNLTKEQIQQGQQEFFAKMAKQGQK